MAHLWRHLCAFFPRYGGRWPLRLRRIGRNPAPVELPEDQPGDRTSPLELAIEAEDYERYRRALTTLTPRERELIVARIEIQWSLAEIAQRRQTGRPVRRVRFQRRALQTGLAALPKIRPVLRTSGVIDIQHE